MIPLGSVDLGAGVEERASPHSYSVTLVNTYEIAAAATHV